SSATRPVGAALLDQSGEAVGHLVFGHTLEPVGRDRGDRRVDASDQVGPPRGRVLVGRLVERPDGDLYRLVPGESFAEGELDGCPGVPAAGAGGREVVLLVGTARRVVGEDATPLAPGVVA